MNMPASKNSSTAASSVTPGDAASVAILCLVLLAIIVPAFGGARVKSRQISCMSNEKQILTGLMMYVQDYDEVVVPSRNFGIIPHNKYTTGIQTEGITFWSQNIYPYLKSTLLFKCPSALRAFVNSESPTAEVDPLYLGFGGQNSYGANGYVFRPNHGLSMSVFTAPASTVAIVDAQYYLALPRGPRGYPCRLAYDKIQHGPSYFDPTSDINAQYWKNIGNSFLFDYAAGEPTSEDAVRLGKQRHAGKINTSFMDGHVKTLDYEVLTRDQGLTVNSSSSLWDPYKLGCQ